MSPINRYVTFNEYIPPGRVDPSHFSIRQQPLRSITEGEVLVRPMAFSVETLLRILLASSNPWFSLPPMHPGDVLSGPAVARVVESRHSDYVVGTLVMGWMPWFEWVIWPYRQVSWPYEHDWMGFEPLAGPSKNNPIHALGVYGVSGLCAYFGMIEVAEVKSGQTVLISAAAGSIGSLAGQIAKIRGAKVVGLTSTEEKRDALIQKLGFDDTLDYRAENFAERLAAVLPSGPDVYFDNVGGTLSQTVMKQMRRPARVIDCGQISTYGEGGTWMVDATWIHMNGLRFEGFTPLLFAEQSKAAIGQLSAWVDAGKLRPLITERIGLLSVPGAVCDLFNGANIGKMIVMLPEN